MRRFARSQQGILARVPPQKMVGLCMCRVMFFRLPHFVEQERSASIRGAMQIVLQATVFLSGWSHQRAKLRFQKRFVSRARPQQYDDGHAMLRQPCVVRPASATRTSPGRLLCLLFRHCGRDCTPTTPFGKQNHRKENGLSAGPLLVRAIHGRIYRADASPGEVLARRRWRSGWRPRWIGRSAERRNHARLRP
jgi:hypothetical protein